MSGLFVNCDWGTSAFRLRLLAIVPWQILAELRSPAGVASLAIETPGDQSAGARADRFQQVLRAGLEHLSQTAGVQLSNVPIVISGMASSSLGWRELPYAALPCRLDGQGLSWCELDPLVGATSQQRVWLISGLRSETDILRGEETEILGLFQSQSLAEASNDSIVIKPGTHSKHVRIQAGQVVDFQTFMTGELFDVLARQSVLRHSVQPPADSVQPAPEVATIATPPGAFTLDTPELSEAVRQATADALVMPLSAALFRVRTRQVLSGSDPASNRAYLSGLLVASELAYLSRSPYLDLPLILCAAAAQHPIYRAVAEELNLSARLTVLEPHEVDQLGARGQALFLKRLSAGSQAG